MRALLNKLCWCVHRALCYVGVHAVERIHTFNEEKADFIVDGSFCAVCIKEWEEK